MKDADEKVKDKGLRWENNKGWRMKVQVIKKNNGKYSLFNSEKKIFMPNFLCFFYTTVTSRIDNCNPLDVLVEFGG